MYRLPARAIAIAIALGLSWRQPAAQTLAAPANKEVSSQSLLALELLHGLYPELLEKSLSLQLEGAPSGLLLRVSETGRPDPERPLLQLATPLLSASLSFGKDSQVERYSAEGPFLQSQKIAALDRALRSHPEWSDSDRAAALVAAGAEYGPGHEPDVEARVRPRAWEKQVGRGARIHIEGFIWKDPAEQDKKDKAAVSGVFGWRARLEAAGPDGRQTQYELVIEPFSGRVTSMTRLGRGGRGQ